MLSNRQNNLVRTSESQFHLLNRPLTTTIDHSGNKDLQSFVRRSDITGRVTSYVDYFNAGFGSVDS